MAESMQGAVEARPVRVTQSSRDVLRRCGGRACDCDHDHEPEQQPLRRFSRSRLPAGPAPAIVSRALAAPGESLAPQLRSHFEARFGQGLGNVRVQRGDLAAASARAVGATAYSVGRQIVFGAGAYDPGSSAGQRLLAHELAHVAQNRTAYVPGRPIEIGAPDHPLEAEAERVADGALPPARRPASATHLLARTIGDGHDLTATRFSGNARLEAAFDGEITLRRGDNGAEVRLVQDSLIAQGFAIAGGATGDYNRATERAVLRFQISSGARFLDGDVGRETMALLDAYDPGPTAATGPVPPIGGPAPPPATAVVFSESPDDMFAGYDSTTNPDWLVVPEDGRRRVRATVTPAGASPAFVSIDPAVASVQTTPEGIVVTGEADGVTRIEAREGAAVLARLRVSVKARRNLRVDYHFMRDSAAPVAHQTARPTSEQLRLTTRLNRIWQRQANVRFRTGTVDTPTAGVDLGGQVLWAAGPASEWPTITAFATGGDYNIFLVWEYEQDATPLVDDANAGTLGSNTLLEDLECGDGLTVAHEAGHFMGLAAHAASGIMSGCPGSNRSRVRKWQADVVNP